MADDHELTTAITAHANDIDNAAKVGDLLQREAQLTKHLYRYAAQRAKQNGFTRDHQGGDPTNGFLNHGNYLAYGLAATTLWVLRIPAARLFCGDAPVKPGAVL
jgi:CRISPR-associated protein Cas1